jgi:hypothetical protein
VHHLQFRYIGQRVASEQTYLQIDGTSANRKTFHRGYTRASCDMAHVR